MGGSCPAAPLASSSWVARSSRAATWASPTRPRPSSSSTPHSGACTTRATSRGTCGTASSSTSGAMTIKSRLTACVSSCWRSMPRSSRRPSSCVMPTLSLCRRLIRRSRRGSWPLPWRPRATRRTRRSFALMPRPRAWRASCGALCRTCFLRTWCLCTLSLCTRSPAPRVRKLTAAPCKPRTTRSTWPPGKHRLRGPRMIRRTSSRTHSPWPYVSGCLSCARRARRTSRSPSWASTRFGPWRSLPTSSATAGL